MSSTDLGAPAGGPKSPGRDDTASPREMATAAIHTVKEEAQSFAASAKEKVSEKVSEKKDTATQTLDDFASAIRKAGDDLAQHDQSLAGKVVKQAADGLESFSRSISDKPPEDLLDAVRDFGRNNPAAFIAGSVLLGIALGRLAKSTEDRGGAVNARESYRRPTDYLSDGSSGAAAGSGENHPAAGAALASPYGSGV